jgi:hypothetical protein
MAANGGPVLLGDATNEATSTTMITNSTIDNTAFSAAAAGTGFGLQGSSTGGAGILGWSITAPTLDPVDAAYTGVWGWSPAAPIEGQVGVGVVGESDDWGVLGLGSVGVWGYGPYGVVGESASPTGVGVTAVAQSATSLALDVQGKVRFSRSGRTSVAAGHSTKVVTLAGVSASSRVFALIHSNRGGRWVRSVVPTTGSFKIYLNGTVSSSTYVAWFVLN